MVHVHVLYTVIQNDFDFTKIQDKTMHHACTCTCNYIVPVWPEGLGP